MDPLSRIATVDQNFPATGPHPDPATFPRQLLTALLALRDGEFAVRLPSDLTGVDGKIADAFNEIAVVSERRSRETRRVSGSASQTRRVPAAK